ncbi:MAG: hypothetical protein ACREXR_07435, partial [Gammaproteobacteria bacterium]
SGKYTPRKNNTAAASESVKEIQGIYRDVDTSSFKFSETPKYAISLSGTSYKWATTGGDAVYDPTKNGFRVYVRRSDDAALTPRDAEDCGLHIHWVALEGESITLDAEQAASKGP